MAYSASLTPLISVVLPCYNQGMYLGDALDSIINQTYTNWECILINDGSTDNTENVALTYCSGDSRIKYFKKENGGLSSTRNFGLEKVSGQYIQFLDSDDCLADSKFQLTIEAFQGQPSSQIVVSDFKLFKNDISNLIEPYHPLKPELFNFKDLLLGWNSVFIIPIHSPIFKKQVLEGFKFEEHLKANEDWIMWLKVFKSHPSTAFITNTFAYYRINPTSMTKDPVFVYDCLINAYKFILRNIAEKYAVDFAVEIIDRLNILIKHKEIQIQKLESTLLNRLIWKVKRLTRRS